MAHLYPPKIKMSVSNWLMAISNQLSILLCLSENLPSLANL